MQELRNIAFVLCLALPWLNPFAPGPSAAMVPWLVSLACVGALLLNAPTVHLPKTVAIFLVAACAYFMGLWWLHGFQNRVEVIATLVAVACAVLCAMVGRGLLAATSEQEVNVRWLAATWLVVACISTAMALCQYFGVEDWFAPWISHAGDGTAFANLRQRNQFASLTGMGLLALVYLQTTQPLTQRTTRVHSLWPFAALLLLATGNAASSSRTAAVQWLLIALLGWGWRVHLPTGARRLLWLAVPLYVVMAVLMPQMAAHASTVQSNALGRMADATGGGRVALYSNVWDLVLQHPWLGWGWRELAYAHYAQAFGQRFPLILDNAHNLPLHLAVELGVPFALLVCVAVVWCVLRGKPWREAAPQRQLAWGVLLLLGVHSLTEYPLWYGPFLITAGLCVGLLCSPPSLEKQNAPRTTIFIAQAATILIAIAAYAGWDYHRMSQIYLSPDVRDSAYADDTLAKAQHSFIYARHTRFAELVTTHVTPQTAPRVLALSADLLHYSPEPRVIQALIESATMLHFDDVAVFHLARFKDVFPKEYAAWSVLTKTP